jgi:hypothetical protein
MLKLVSPPPPPIHIYFFKFFKLQTLVLLLFTSTSSGLRVWTIWLMSDKYFSSEFITSCFSFVMREQIHLVENGLHVIFQIQLVYSNSRGEKYIWASGPNFLGNMGGAEFKGGGGGGFHLPKADICRQPNFAPPCMLFHYVSPLTLHETTHKWTFLGLLKFPNRNLPLQTSKSMINIFSCNRTMNRFSMLKIY